MNLRPEPTNARQELSMYTPTGSAMKQSMRSEGGPMESRKSRSSNKVGSQGGSVGYQEARKQVNQTQIRPKSKTPSRTLDGDSSQGLKATQSDARLNKLIADYRQENDRCTAKINALKMKLNEQHDRPRTAVSPGGIQNDSRVYAKSFKVTQQSRKDNVRGISGSARKPRQQQR